MHSMCFETNTAISTATILVFITAATDYFSENICTDDVNNYCN